MSQTPAAEVRELLVATIKADPSLAPILNGKGKKVFLGEAPTGSDAPYVVIGTIPLDTARGAGRYHQPGRRHRRRVAGWADSIVTAELIYGHLVRLFDGRRLALDGHTMVTGVFDFLAGPRRDPKTKLWGFDGEYTVRTLEAV